MTGIEYSIQYGDITTFDADVLALKYAQAFYGADRAIALQLATIGISVASLQPKIDDYRYLETRNCIKSRHALFVGVPDLQYFDYQQIREFAEQTLHILKKAAPDTIHLAMTIHGPGFGLDEVEAAFAQFAGYIDAIKNGQFPKNLKYISIVSKGSEQVQRLQHAFEQNLAMANYASRVKGRWAYLLTIERERVHANAYLESTSFIESAGKGSKTKLHVFVAMPFKKDMDDVFFYGIQRPVHNAGFLCERVDQEAFIGDILNQVKEKIETAVVVIAEISNANPNVYLEVGYAWGKGRPTILLVKDQQELPFDIRGQRCLKYESIRNLDETLGRELQALQAQNII